MATKIMKSAILPASRYKDDRLSHLNLNTHGSGVNYNTRAFAKSQGSLIPRIATNNRGPNNLLHLTVFCYCFVFFFSLSRRCFKKQIVRKFRKLGTAMICRILRFFVAFVPFLILTWRRFRIQQILRKLREIVVATICCNLRFFVTSLLFSIGRRGLLILTNP